MSTSSQQKIAMSIIVLVGVIAIAAVLMTGRREPPHQEEPASQKIAPHGPGQTEAHLVKLNAEQIRRAGIATLPAGPASIRPATEFAGEVRFNDDRTAHVVPRLAGVTEAVSVNLGETVRPGQVLAVIASTALSEQRSELLTAQRRRDAAMATFEREKRLWEGRISAQQDYLEAQTALQEADIAVQNARQKLAAVGASPGPRSGPGLNRFEIRAPFGGTIVEKHLSLGEAVKEDASIFTLSDMRTVWAEFVIAPKDLALVKVGQKVRVSTSAFDTQADGTVSTIGALIGEQTRTARARVTLDNPQGLWRPGLFVTVSVLGDGRAVPLAVSAGAIQTIDGKAVVFKVVPDGFLAVPVITGRSDGHQVEVLGGLKPGDEVASSNTFVLKAEQGKSGVEEH